jgi:4'-phosphopantetheinyl transferase EntD
VLALEDIRLVVSAPVALGLRRVSTGAPAGLPDQDASRSGSAFLHRDEEFARGRAAAIEALTSLGFGTDAVRVGERGEPRWPDRVVGSITHTADIALAVAARTSDVAAIGIDIERQDRRLDARTMRRICTPLELILLTEEDNDGLSPLILFCAKEATYKALSGFVSGLGWHDVDFNFDGTDRLTGVLSARAAQRAPVATVEARVLVAGGFVVVCVEIPAEADVIPASLVPSARAGTALGAPGSH